MTRNNKRARKNRTRHSIVQRLDTVVKLFVFTAMVMAVGLLLIAHLLYDIRINGL